MADLFGCRHVTRRYQGVAVVEDVSLSLDKGELVTLLGVSGVGKSTLFGILAGVDKPDEGEVYLEGRDVTGTAGKVGYMLQKDLLLPYKTVVDNVSLPLIIRGVPKGQARETAAKQFARFGLKGYESSYPHQLSGGMRQRAALLRTSLLGSGIMLLDEPFSALDTITKLEMYAWYLGVVEQLGHATLLITHDIDEALTLSDRILIMSGKPGRITREIRVAAGRPRGEDYITSESFVLQKREILSHIRQP